MRLAASGEQGGIADIPFQRQLKSTRHGDAQAFVQSVGIAATKFGIASKDWLIRSPLGFPSSVEVLSTDGLRTFSNAFYQIPLEIQKVEDVAFT